MKRTEKIEVRLSHEEKQSLSELAEGEGRTVSDLVRGLIERYVSLNTARLPQKPRWALWSGLVAAGLLVGHLGTWGVIRGAGNIKSVSQEFDVYELSMGFTQTLSNGQLSGQNFGSSIVLKNGFKDNYLIEREGSDYKVVSKVYRAENDVTRVGIKVCVVTAVDCEEIANQLLTIVAPQPASTAIVSDSLNMIGIDLKWVGRTTEPAPV